MKKVIALSIMFLAVSLFSSVFALENAREAVIVDIKGVVEVQKAAEKWKAAEKGMVLAQGDTVRTKSDSQAVLGVDDEGKTTTVEMKENSQLQLAVLLGGKEAAVQSTLLDLSMGEVLIKAQKIHSEESKFEVKTPTSIVGIRGTIFSVTVEAGE